ncbi:MAG: transcriptional regulator NrdR [Bdellovibrionaceae bacterium]|nr:transcriptional regulator NrdR [Pseudobdellovibrionaceae bacterium]
MKCPHCQHLDHRVLETRVQKDGEIRRRRECLNCKGRFSTAEMLLLNEPYIIKKDGRREPFDRDKLKRGIQLACQKRPVSLAQIEHIVEKIAKWTIQLNRKEVRSELIGQALMQELKRLDDVAYIRFASVYRTFRDVNEFVEALELDTNKDSERQTFHDAP